MNIRLENNVVIITGAANGLGKTYAIEFAKRGAQVVVCDLAPQTSTDNGALSPVQRVATEIESFGGKALALHADVTKPAEVNAMVKKVIDTWGRIDVLVNNAGILRDKTFAKVPMDDFRLVLEVHLMGAVNCTKAVWDTMKAQGSGTVIMTTSSSGLYGNFGQSNYGAAKMGLIGLMNVLAIEGAKHGIKVNAISPCAATQMLSGLIDEQANAALTLESVAAGLLFLASDYSPSKFILCAGAGVYSSARIYETEGIYLTEQDQTPEQIAAHLDEICDTTNQ